MRIITNRYRKETGKSAYKFNWFGKRLHNQDYIDWLEKQCTINSVTQRSELLLDYTKQLKKQGTLTKGQNEKKLVNKYLSNNSG